MAEPKQKKPRPRRKTFQALAACSANGSMSVGASGVHDDIYIIDDQGNRIMNDTGDVEVR